MASGSNKKNDKEKKQFEKDLREMFDVFDKNADNSISVGEFGKVLRSMGLDMTNMELKTAVKQIDANRNGKIEFGEFRNFMLKQYKKSSKDGDSDKEIRQAFRLFDRDGSGFIDKHEIRRAMKTLGEPLTESEAQMMIKDADKDGDGKIGFEEFTTMWKRKFQE